MPRCHPPKCEREHGRCVQPNPWIVFLKSGRAKGLTSEQRKKAYEEFKTELLSRTSRDPVAYRAALCLNRPARPSRMSTASKFHAWLSESARRNNPYYTKECTISGPILAFFQSMFATSIRSTTLTPCELIGMRLLQECVSKKESKYYTFHKVLGVGRQGFVFDCLYKAQIARAVKLVVIDDVESDIQIGDEHEIETTTEAQFRHEVDMHRQLLSRVSPVSRFRVLDITGQVAIFKPSRRFRQRVGVYVMEKLSVPTLHKELYSRVAVPIADHLASKVKAIPLVIRSLHRLGYAHGDLHMENIAFDPNDMDRPVVLDFGRTCNLATSFPSARDRSMFRLADYTINLYALSRIDDDLDGNINPVELTYAAELYKLFVDAALPLLRDDLAVVRKQTKDQYLNRIFSPVQARKAALEDRNMLILDMLRTHQAFTNGRTYFDVIET